MIVKKVDENCQLKATMDSIRHDLEKNKKRTDMLEEQLKHKEFENKEIIDELNSIRKKGQ